MGPTMSREGMEAGRLVGADMGHVTGERMSTRIDELINAPDETQGQ